MTKQMHYEGDKAVKGQHRVAVDGSPWVWVAVGIVPITFLAIFFAWPVIALVARGFVDSDGAFTGAGVASILSSPRTWRIVGQTLSQALVGTVVSVLLGIPGAYVLYRLSIPGQRFLRAIVIIPFVLPSVVVGVAFASLINENGLLGFLNLKETFTAVVAALVFFNYAVVVRTVGTLWARLDPRTEQAARSLGASHWRVLLTVTLPALAPAIASAAALVFLFCASAFGVVLVLGGVSYGTVETEIYYQTTKLLDLPTAAALSILQLIIICTSLLVSNVTRSRNERALRLTSNASSERPQLADMPAIIITAVTILGLLLTPLICLLWRSLQTEDGIGIDNYLALGGIAGKSVTVSVWAATANSLWTALLATLIAITVGIAVSYVLSRHPKTSASKLGLQVFDSAFMLPLGVSAVTVGFGFLITLNRPPLDMRSSWLLIPIAQAIVALPLVVRTLLPTWRAIDPRTLQAAASLGANSTRLFASIEIPLVLRSLGLAIGFAFATSLGEFGATSFLTRPDRPTLPVIIFKLISRPGVENLGMALAASVVLAVLTAVVMATAELLGGAESGRTGL